MHDLPCCRKTQTRLPTIVLLNFSRKKEKNQSKVVICEELYDSLKDNFRFRGVTVEKAGAAPVVTDAPPVVTDAPVAADTTAAPVTQAPVTDAPATADFSIVMVVLAAASIAAAAAIVLKKREN